MLAMTVSGVYVLLTRIFFNVVVYAVILYMLGQVQMKFMKDGEPDLAYSDLFESFYQMIGIVIDNKSDSSFDKGDNRTIQVIIKVFFMFLCIYFAVLILNFLIALMGDIFQKNHNLQPQINCRSMLLLVLDNWILIQWLGKNEFK